MFRFTTLGLAAVMSMAPCAAAQTTPEKPMTAAQIEEMRCIDMYLKKAVSDDDKVLVGLSELEFIESDARSEAAAERFQMAADAGEAACKTKYGWNGSQVMGAFSVADNQLYVDVLVHALKQRGVDARLVDKAAKAIEADDIRRIRSADYFTDKSLMLRAAYALADAGFPEDEGLLAMGVALLHSALTLQDSASMWSDWAD